MAHSFNMSRFSRGWNTAKTKRIARPENRLFLSGDKTRNSGLALTGVLATFHGSPPIFAARTIY
jgi:hypothetical protein